MLCIIFPRIVDHTSTRARAHTHTHTHTHTVVAQPRGTHFLRLTQKLRRKRQSRGKLIKKKKVRKNLLFRLQNERDTVIYTRYMERERKRRNEREREKIKKKERRKGASHEYRIANSTDFNESINVELGGLLSIGL